MWDSSGVIPPVEYWYNLVRKCWSGPHGPITALEIDFWRGTFLEVSNLLSTSTNGIYVAPTNSNPNAGYIENGATLAFAMQSVVLEDNYSMAESELAELQIMASGAPTTLAVRLLNPYQGTLYTSSVNAAQVGAGAFQGLYPFRVDWPSPPVVNRFALLITGQSSASVLLGDSWMRLRTLSYIVNNT